MQPPEALQHEPSSVKNKSQRPTLLTQSSFAVGGALTSIFEIISHPSSSIASSVSSTPPQTAITRPTQSQSIQHDVRPAIIQDIQELIEELDSSEHNISEHAMQVIHNNEIILTYGLPSTVKKLLLRAAQKRDFTVVVVEGSLNIYRGTHTAVVDKDTPSGEDEEVEIAARKSLQERGIQIIVISDSDVWNFMSRVNKVLLGTEYVFADGGLLAPAGTKNIVRAAKARSTPVVVVTGSHTLCPITTFFEEQWVEMGGPKTLDFQEGLSYHSSLLRRILLIRLTGYLLEHVDVPSPIIDFIPASYVGSFVTNKYAPYPSYPWYRFCLRRCLRQKVASWPRTPYIALRSISTICLSAISHNEFFSFIVLLYICFRRGFLLKMYWTGFRRYFFLNLFCYSFHLDTYRKEGHGKRICRYSRCLLPETDYVPTKT